MKPRLRPFVIAVAISLLCSTGLWAQGVTISAPDSTTIVVDAGEVATRVVVLQNDSESDISVRLIPSMPSGWTMLIPPPRQILRAGSRRHQLISFQVPHGTPAGTYQMVVVLESGGAPALNVRVEVKAAYSLAGEWIEASEFVRAGDRISSILTLTNTGNADAQWNLRARSSLGYTPELIPSTLFMEKGTSQQVIVGVGTGGDITSRLTHSLTVFIAREGQVLQEAKSFSFTTEILPTRQGSISFEEGLLPVSLSFSASQEEGSNPSQIELSLPKTQAGSKSYEGLIRVPDVRKSSAFALPDRYSLRVASPGFELLIGDHTYSATPLLESGSLGFGGGLKLHRENVSFGGYVQQSRHVFPKRQQVAAFLRYHIAPALSVEANVISKRAFEEGDAVSIGAQVSPGESVIRAEYARGKFGGRDGQAFHVDANSSFGQSSISAQFESASASFLGSIQNTEGASTSFTFGVSSWLKLQGQARTRKRYYDLAGGLRATQTTTSARGGLVLTASKENTRVTAAFSVLQKVNDNTLSNLNRRETSLEARLGLNRRQTGLNLSVSGGRTKDLVSPDPDPYRSATASVFATSSDQAIA